METNGIPRQNGTGSATVGAAGEHERPLDSVGCQRQRTVVRRERGGEIAGTGEPAPAVRPSV